MAQCLRLDLCGESLTQFKQALQSIEQYQQFKLYQTMNEKVKKILVIVAKILTYIGTFIGGIISNNQFNL